jgi:hypothetical protein
MPVIVRFPEQRIQPSVMASKEHRVGVEPKAHEKFDKSEHEWYAN